MVTSDLKAPTDASAVARTAPADNLRLHSASEGWWAL